MVEPRNAGPQGRETLVCSVCGKSTEFLDQTELKVCCEGVFPQQGNLPDISDREEQAVLQKGFPVTTDQTPVQERAVPEVVVQEPAKTEASVGEVTSRQKSCSELNQSSGGTRPSAPLIVLKQFQFERPFTVRFFDQFSAVSLPGSNRVNVTETVRLLVSQESLLSALQFSATSPSVQIESLKLDDKYEVDKDTLRFSIPSRKEWPLHKTEGRSFSLQATVRIDGEPPQVCPFAAEMGYIGEDGSVWQYKTSNSDNTPPLVCISKVQFRL